MTAYTPFDFQEDDINNLLENGCRGFVVAETGAGKSIIGIETGLRSGAKVILVISPAGDVQEEVWRDGILRQDPTANVRIVDGSAKGLDAYDALQMEEPGWYLMSTQLLTRWDLAGVRPDLTIVDEAHMLANRDANGNKKLRKIKSAGRIVMSGTMIRNKLDNFWGLLRWVYEEMSGVNELADISPNRWIANYLATEYDQFKVNNIKIIGEKEPGRIAREIPCYIQHFKRAECCEYHPNGFLSELDAPTEEIYEVDLTEGQQKAIKRMTEDYIAWLTTEAETRRALVVKLPIVARTRLRQMTLGMPSFRQTGIDDRGMPVYEIWFAPGCESPKLDQLHERLMRTGDEPYLVLTSSEKFATEAVRRITEDWGITAAKWAGTVSKKERAQSKQDFIAGKIRVVVGVIEAVSTGIDGLQFATNRLFWLDQSDDTTSNIQTEGRADRRGQTVQVTNERVVARGSMDLGIMDKDLKRRLRINASLKRELNRQKRKIAA